MCGIPRASRKISTGALNPRSTIVPLRCAAARIPTAALTPQIATRINTIASRAPSTRATVPRPRLRSDVDIDVVAFDANRKRRHADDRRQRQRVAGAHVEVCAVARASHGVAFQPALIQRAAVVRADVFDRIDRSIGIAEQDFNAVDDGAQRSALRYLRKFCRRNVSHAGGLYAPLVVSAY